MVNVKPPHTYSFFKKPNRHGKVTTMEARRINMISFLRLSLLLMVFIPVNTNIITATNSGANK